MTTDRTATDEPSDGGPGRTRSHVDRRACRSRERFHPSWKRRERKRGTSTRGDRKTDGGERRDGRAMSWIGCTRSCGMLVSHEVDGLVKGSSYKVVEGACEGREVTRVSLDEGSFVPQAASGGSRILPRGRPCAPPDGPMQLLSSRPSRRSWTTRPNDANALASPRICASYCFLVDPSAKWETRPLLPCTTCKENLRPDPPNMPTDDARTKSPSC